MASSPEDRGLGAARLGPLRGAAWLAGAAWWAVKSPAGWAALAAASLPWLATSILNLATGGMAMGLAVGFYAQLCLWSAMCAGSHFGGGAFLWPKARAAWLPLARKSGSLALCFAVCAVAAMAWTQFWVSTSGLGAFLEALREAKPGQAEGLLAVAWAREGLDGLALPLAIMQAGLGVINGFWCLLPWAAVELPEQGMRARLAWGWAALRSAPGALWTLGMVGALLAQFSLVAPPFAMLSGVWFLACAFAARDLGVDPLAGKI